MFRFYGMNYTILNNKNMRPGCFNNAIKGHEPQRRVWVFFLTHRKSIKKTFSSKNTQKKTSMLVSKLVKKDKQTPIYHELLKLN